MRGGHARPHAHLRRQLRHDLQRPHHGLRDLHCRYGSPLGEVYAYKLSNSIFLDLLDGVDSMQLAVRDGHAHAHTHVQRLVRHCLRWSHAG
jgi:hypothetical protein